MAALDARLALVRRWAGEWLAGADPQVAQEILAPGYAITISGTVLEGRDAYVEATLGQLQRFPGLGMTVHELIDSGDDVAVRFTQHGASARHDGRLTAWAGIALFSFDGAQLARCWAEEDYVARRRQLDTGEVDPIAAPAPSPWTSAAAEPDEHAAGAVRAWLRDGPLDAVALDDAPAGHPAPPLLDDARTELDAVVAAGARVAFHGRQSGTYRGGLPGVDGAARGRPAAHGLAGIVTVSGDGGVTAGHVVRDRLGLARTLAGTAD